MGTTVTITGSGCPIPDPRRAGPGALVRTGDLTLQFDVGRSTVQRLAGAGVWIPDLTAVFVTHHHSDHLVGLADLVLTHWTMDREDRGRAFPIVAPSGPSARFAGRVLDGWEDDIDVRAAHAKRSTRPEVELIAFDVGDTPTEVWRSGDVSVKAGPVRHEPVTPAVGYRIDTPDGSVAITGDTRVCDEVAALADGVDVLVYEAMRMEPIERLPQHRRFIMEYHADTIEIGRQAAVLGVPTLVLTHLIPPPDDDAERQQFVDDVRSGGYQGDVLVADDLLTVVVGAAG
ncbi:MAG: MBL fold metallo-hydrolase [Ilumatobacter sp.]|nr:MBL fold metallo-hydrolase [Ilumatobacter sp.]